MKINYLMVMTLLTIGILVGGISLYMASLSGVMGKMGLVGGDFSQSIKGNDLARQIMARDDQTNCNLWEVVKHVPGYMFLKGEKRIMLSGELGNERVICGIKLVQAGNVERGVYTIIKGLHYLRSHFAELRELVQSEKGKCELVGDPLYEEWVEGYLVATEGRVHEVVIDVYHQVQSARSRVEELCTE